MFLEFGFIFCYGRLIFTMNRMDLIIVLIAAKCSEAFQKLSIFIGLDCSLLDRTSWTILFVIVFVQFDVDLVIMLEIILLPWHNVAMHVLDISKMKTAYFTCLKSA